MSMDRCYNLAEQVLFDILLYLPVISLLRFKAVCKNWFSLIESSDFISEHLNHNRDSKEEDFIILSNVTESKFAMLCGSQYEECVYDIGIGQFWHSTAGSLFLYCYCDGIVFLGRRRNETAHEIALWNPALKQFRPIPPPLFSDRLCFDMTFDFDVKSDDYELFEERSTTFDVSIGFDVKSNDYKLVGIMIDYMDIIGNQVEVFNVGGDNSWRIIHKNDVLPFSDIASCYSISSGKSGKCFWKASGYENTKILLSFDFSDDVFRTMLLPDVGDVSSFDLDFLDDKVVYIVEKTSTDQSEAFDIWMLHEFGVEESWNKIYKVGPFMYFSEFSSWRISNNGEFLICGKQGKLYLYNLHTQQGKFVQNCNLNISTDVVIIHYNASLLSLKSANIVRPTD